MRSIYRPRLNTGERQAMDMEIKRQCAEYDSRNATEIDAMVLWILHEEFGFGPARLRRFHERFFADMDALVERYEMKDEPWLCTQKLKEYGVDVAEWKNNSVNQEVLNGNA